MAENEMKAKRSMPQGVRLSEGLGGSRAVSKNAGLEQLPISLQQAPSLTIGVQRSPGIWIVANVLVHTRTDYQVGAGLP